MQHIENIKGSPVICQSGPQSPPRGRWMFLFLVYRVEAASETLTRPKLGALRLESVVSMPGSLFLRRMLSCLPHQASGSLSPCSQVNILSSPMMHCEEGANSPIAKECASCSAAIGWDMIKTFGFLSTARIKSLKNPCSAFANSASLPLSCATLFSC